MKIKTISILLTIMLITFLIYTFNKDDKVYLLNLGNNSQINEIEKYLESKKKLEKAVNISSDINKIIDYIKTNKKIQEHTMKNHLIKADLIIISSNSKNDNINELIKIIKEYSKEQIIIIAEESNENKTVSRNNKIQLFNKKSTYEAIINFIEENIIKY